MATVYFTGTADAVAQVSTGSIDSVDATPSNNTFTVTIGGEAVTVTGDTDGNTTATALRSALNSSSHPYFAAVTWSGSAGNITGTADTAGAPFVATLSKAGGGTGTVTDFAVDTANAGPNDWNTAANWNTAAVPVNADDVIIESSSTPICWNLSQSAVTLASLTIRKTYTGRIGLNVTTFTTDASGTTASATVKPEYRQSYLNIGWDACDIGEHSGPGTPSGATRLKLDNAKSGASTTTVHSTASSTSDTGKPVVRLLLAHASATVQIRSAQQGVGIATDLPGETSTVGTVSVSDTTTTSKVYIGDGVTLTTFEQAGGVNELRSAGNVTTVDCNGGVLTTEGDFTATALNINGGTCYCNHIASSGNATVTTNLRGGVLDLQQSNESRTHAALVHTGGTLRDNDAVTITSRTNPPRSTVVVS